MAGKPDNIKGTGMLVGERTDTMPVLTRRRRFWDAAHVHIPKKITRSFSTDRWLVCVLSARSLRNTHTYGVQSLMKLACVRPRLFVGGCIQQHTACCYAAFAATAGPNHHALPLDALRACVKSPL